MFNGLTLGKNIKTRSVSAENPTGGKGRGAMAESGFGENAARELGKGWKVSPAITVKAGETAILADIKAKGAIKHIWITDGCAMARGLILRIYWDKSKKPSVEAPLDDFFANAGGYSHKQLSSLPVCVNPRKGYNCYWEMPLAFPIRIKWK